MPRKKTPAHSAAGKLILAIQKVWGYRLGTEQAAEAEEIMGRAHDLHQAAGAGRLRVVLSGRSVCDYLGADWVACHPSVESAAKALQSALDEEAA